MKFTLSWLKDHLDTQAHPHCGRENKELACEYTKRGHAENRE